MRLPTPARQDPRTIIEVFMPWLSIYGSVRQAIQDLVAPEIQALHGEIKRIEGKMEGKIDALEGKIEGLGTKIESLRSEMNARFEASNRRVTGVEQRLDSVEAIVRENSRKIDTFIEERIESHIKSMDEKWHEAIDIHERLAALEAKLEQR